ncbi:MAG TPA: hypothetical protein VEI07_23540 [Planctomycetaceae bacterium]|nr:hypothetical protein [Planctomycetaceae bacterium]
MVPTFAPKIKLEEVRLPLKAPKPVWRSPRGVRTHLGNDWYFLAGLPIPLIKERVADLGMIFWFMKAW